jgi:hypothetical protein
MAPVGARFTVFNTFYTDRLAEDPTFLRDIRNEIKRFGALVVGIVDDGVWYVPQDDDTWKTDAPSPMGDREVPDGSIVFEVKDPADTCKVLCDFAHECRSYLGDHAFCGCFDGVPYAVDLTGDMIVFKFDTESG